MQAAKEFFGKLNAPYYVYAPPYRETSGGVRAMHYLCHALNLLGEEAYVITDTVLPSLRTPSLTAHIREVHERAGREPIVVYPEIIEDNPLNARNVVRYLLNVPGSLNRRKLRWLNTDLIYTHGKDIVPPGIDAPLLQTPLINMFIYNQIGVDEHARSGSLVFIHRYLAKGGQLQSETENSKEISYRVPTRTPQELAQLYQHAEVLYTYEQSTACYEAMLCGCPVVYLPNPLLLPQPPIGYLGRDGWAWGNTEEQVAFAKSTVHKVVENYHATQIDFWDQLRSFVGETQAHAAHANRRHGGKPLFISDSPLSDAIEAYNCGDIDETTRLLTGMLESGSDAPLAYAYLSFVCAHQHLVEDADNFIRQALSLAPERAELLAALGEAFLKAGMPDKSQSYLKEAIQFQPDLFAAYPALAEAMRQCGDSESAIQLLSAAVQLPTTAQDGMFASLSELLTVRGDISALAELCLRRRHDIAAQALGINLLARTGSSPDRVLTELDRYRERFLPSPTVRRLTGKNPQQNYLTIAFLISDFRRESQNRRLESLLVHLPGERYQTLIIDNDPASDNVTETDIQRAFLVSDHWVSIHALDDAAATQALAEHTIDVLVDTDGLAIRNRQALFLSLPAELKACWSDLPIALGEIRLIAGAADLDAANEHLTGSAKLALPGIGRSWHLPDLDIRTNCMMDELQFACLTPAVRVGRESWELFADILQAHPGSRLTINLGELDVEAENFIQRIFAARDVRARQLSFIHAISTEDLCRAWNDADVGLGPIGIGSDNALATSLWMNRPCITLDSPWPWSSGAASLLRSVGLENWIATSRENYVEKALNAHHQARPVSLRDSLRTALPTPQAMAAAFDDALTRALREMRQ